MSILYRRTDQDEELWNSSEKEPLPKLKVEPMFRDRLEHILQHPPDPHSGRKCNDHTNDLSGQASASSFETSNTGANAPSSSRDDENETSDSDVIPIRSPFDIRLYAGALQYKDLDSSVFDSSTLDTYETYETIAFSAESSESDTDPPIRNTTQLSGSTANRENLISDSGDKKKTDNLGLLDVPHLVFNKRGSIRSNTSRKSVSFSTDGPIFINAEPEPDYEEEIPVPTTPARTRANPSEVIASKLNDTIRLREIYGKPIVSSTAVAKVNPIYVEDFTEDEQKDDATEPEVALSVKDAYIQHTRIEKYKLKSDIKNNNQPDVEQKGKEPRDIGGIWVIDQEEPKRRNSFNYELRGYDTLIKKTLNKERRRRIILLVILAILVVLFFTCGVALITYFAIHAS